jgi:hypothetical protein
MTLLQIFNLVSKRSFFSRDDDEVWAAISSASRTLFLEVQEENRGFFIVFDTTSLVAAVEPGRIRAAAGLQPDHQAERTAGLQAIAMGGMLPAEI